MRSRVHEAIQRLDYRPSTAARALRGSSYTLGMELPHLTNPFLMEVAGGAREALVDTPYQLLVVAPMEGPEQGAIETLVDHRVDGISPLVRSAWLEEIAERVPLVMVGRHNEAARYDSVVGDDLHGARQAMTHLLRLGHRRIVHLTQSKEVTAKGSGTPHALRLETYLECMRAAGLESAIRVVHLDEEERAARGATRALLGEAPRPTAIFAVHDSLAFGALAAVADAGLTSREVSVVGYDNIWLAGHPLISLTSVDQSALEIGQQVVAMLLERIRGRDAPRRHVIRPQRVLRTSTAAPPVETT